MKKLHTLADFTELQQHRNSAEASWVVFIKKCDLFFPGKDDHLLKIAPNSHVHIKEVKKGIRWKENRRNICNSDFHRPSIFFPNFIELFNSCNGIINQLL